VARREYFRCIDNRCAHGVGHGYVFASIGAAAPRSGADYVVASRYLFVSKSWAFNLVVWTLIIFSGARGWRFSRMDSQECNPRFISAIIG